MKVLHVMTVPMTLTFLRGQVGYMKARGYDIHALASPGAELEAFGREEEIAVHPVRMTRRITPTSDAVAFVRLWQIIRRLRPEILHAHTPKAGLLAIVAGALVGVPIRIYQMRGLPLATARGFRRHLLRGTERIACGLAHEVLCNSHSLRTMAISEGLVRPAKIRVLLRGSGNGVDATGRFDPGARGLKERQAIRSDLGMPEDAVVIGFVGRIVREKGIGELEEAWREIRNEFPLAWLLIVGPFETQDPVPGRAVERLQGDTRVCLLDLDWETPRLYSAMDLVVLPSYREGFPNVPLEAAAMRLPVVATSVPGCVDAVSHGETGLLVPPRDGRALAAAMRTYLADTKLRCQHGEAGRKRVLRDFRQECIWDALHAEYLRLSNQQVQRSKVVTHVGENRAKRLFDIMCAAGGLFLLAPVLCIVALLVRVSLGSPILFRQVRPGLHGRPFMMLKFRTMRNSRDKAGLPLPDEERLTTIGQFLRHTSLDELPELWNVLIGDMSLVGPRPLLMEYLPLYTDYQARRHEVRPGMTGWAQVHGRNNTTWENRLARDVWYVDHRSLWLDIRILFRTLKSVVLREGIQQKGQATMERFHGTPV